LLVAPVNDRGEVILEAYGKLLCPRTKMVALTQVSECLGTIHAAQQMSPWRTPWGMYAG